MGKYAGRGREPEGTGRAGAAAADAEFESMFPALHEWLTLTLDENSRPIETLTVLLFAEEGRFKACLRDRQGKAVCFLSGATMLDLANAIEGVLSSGGGDWRAERPQGGRPGKRGS